MNFGIIAAGNGSRLQEEGMSLPKPLVEIGGRPMIGRLIDIFRRCGAEKINIIVNREMPEVADYLESLKKTPGLRLEVLVKSTPSSMHSMFELMKMMNNEGKFIVTTVDTIFREESFKSYVDAFSKCDDALDGMMAVTAFVEDEKPLWVKTDRDDMITAFLDNREEGVEYVSGGIYGLTRSCVDVLDACISEGVERMRNYQRALIKNGKKLKAYEMAKILDVDHLSDLEYARKYVAEENL